MLPTTFAVMPTPLANPSAHATWFFYDMASQLSASLLENTPQDIKTSEDPLYPPDIPAAQNAPLPHHCDNKQQRKLEILASNGIPGLHNPIRYWNCSCGYALALHPQEPGLPPDVDELCSALPERCFLGAPR